jgi:hypothetical protein
VKVRLNRYGLPSGSVTSKGVGEGRNSIDIEAFEN